MQKTSENLEKKINIILNSLQQQRLEESLKKMQNQIDALKYYLHLTKSKEKSVEYLKVVVADMENMLRYDVKQNYELFKQRLIELSTEDKNKKHDEKVQISANSNFDRLQQLMTRKDEMLKEAQIRANEMKKAN